MYRWLDHLIGLDAIGTTNMYCRCSARQITPGGRRPKTKVQWRGPFAESDSQSGRRWWRLSAVQNRESRIRADGLRRNRHATDAQIWIHERKHYQQSSPSFACLACRSVRIRVDFGSYTLSHAARVRPGRRGRRSREIPESEAGLRSGVDGSSQSSHQ